MTIFPYHRKMLLIEEIEATTLLFNYQNAVNAGALRVATPVITPAGGEFDDPTYVTMVCSDPNVTIYYVLDGSVPSIENTVYTGPFLLSLSANINAFAVDNTGVKKSSMVVGSSYDIKS